MWPELFGAGGEGSRLLGYGLGLASAILTALALITVRTLNRTESPGAIALYFVVASMLGALATLPWGWVMPDPGALVALIAAGIFGGFGHIAMTLAFRFAEASRLAPFEYVALLWPILADLVIFDLPVSRSFAFALPLILLGAVVAASERRTKQGAGVSARSNRRLARREGSRTSAASEAAPDPAEPTRGRRSHRTAAAPRSSC